MAQSFKLSASLSGHEDDVRGVTFPSPSKIVSASRDTTVRLWALNSETPPHFDDTIISNASSFINAVAFIPKSSEYPDGLTVSGSREGLVEVRSPNKLPDDGADALLIGHANNVCALDVSQDGSIIVSGSWDTTARIWHVGKWSTEDSVVLQGHKASVWAVLAYSTDIIITGSADKHIRIFDPKGKLLRKFQASEDVIRALIKLPPSHSSGAQFASAGNDGIIRFWTLEGIQLGILSGHENFIYSLAVLPTGELVSSSEDRTARIWKNDKCIQTITHPAISVWSVAICQQNGDIVTGASDKTVRVFSRSIDRHADAQVLKQFEESVQASSIPQQSLGDINKTDMPGPEFLQQKSGTKDGQVQLIKEQNGNVAAYQWSVQGNEWISVGTVVDSAGGANKISHDGKDYDYVFDVDIEEGKPPLKLPYNATDNPYEAARKFIEDNKLPMTYLDEVTNFITKNTQGTAIGSQARGQAQASDPWGTESRYRPGEQAPAAPAAPPPQKILPQQHYLAISTGSHQMILKKIREFNEQLFSEGRKDLVLNDTDLAILGKTIKQLEPMAGKSEASISIDPASINASLRAIAEWPVDKRLPWLDFLRLQVAASSDPITILSPSPSADSTDDLVSRLAAGGSFGKDAPANNIMLAIRTIANLFASKPGRTLAEVKFETILTLIEPHVSLANKNLAIALTTLYINYAVLFTSSAAADPDRALGLLAALMDILKTATDPEALYRALVAAGTVLCLGKDFADVAKEGLDLEDAIDRAEKVGKEDRIVKIVREIRSHLG